MRISKAAMAMSALALVLAACSKPAETGSGRQTEAGAASDPGRLAFAQCMACHATQAGQNGLGPSLAGVVGRKAGTLEGYSFSEAMKGSGLTWDEASLDTYLTNPRKMVPGTRMNYAGMADAAKRKALIGYLKSLN